MQLPSFPDKFAILFQSFTKRSYPICSVKKKLFQKLVKSLNFASKKYNLRKAEGLKFTEMEYFFLQKLCNCYKEDFTKPEV